MKFRILTKIFLAITIPEMMVDKPSWVRIISAAARAASVAPATAIPTSALFNAGASLVPSPVTATT